MPGIQKLIAERCGLCPVSVDHVLANNMVAISPIPGQNHHNHSHRKYHDSSKQVLTSDDNFNETSESLGDG
jgi:hypothetical protein